MTFSAQETAQIVQELHRNGSVTTTLRVSSLCSVENPSGIEDILRCQKLFWREETLVIEEATVDLEH